MSSASWWLFLAGLGSMTEVHFFGSIAITELAMFVVAPILFLKNFHRLRHDGLIPFVWLAILTCVGCIYANQLLRAAYPAMKTCAERILNCARAQEASQELCMPIKEIVGLI